MCHQKRFPSPRTLRSRRTALGTEWHTMSPSFRSYAGCRRCKAGCCAFVPCRFAAETTDWRPLLKRFGVTPCGSVSLPVVFGPNTGVYGAQTVVRCVGGEGCWVYSRVVVKCNRLRIGDKDFRGIFCCLRTRIRRYKKNVVEENG